MIEHEVKPSGGSVFFGLILIGLGIALAVIAFIL